MYYEKQKGYGCFLGKKSYHISTWEGEAFHRDETFSNAKADSVMIHKEYDFLKAVNFVCFRGFFQTQLFFKF